MAVMFCTQCGSKIPENSKFCGSCGTKVEAQVQPEEIIHNPGVDVIIDAPEWPNPEDIVPKEESVSQKKFDLKNLDLKKNLIAAGALVVAIALILGLCAMFASKGSDNAFICYSDGKYKLITDMKKAKTVNIASAKSDEVDYYSVRFSPDGKYVYFFTKYDDYSSIGSLCRAEYGKLKDGSSRNEKYIETIASNVEAHSLYITESGEVFYRNGDDILFHYNGKEVTQLAKRVDGFKADEKGRVVYTTTDDEGQYSLYGLKLKSPEERTKLVSNFSDLNMGDDLDNMLYTKYEDDGTQTLYTCDFSGNEEKLGENASIIRRDEDKVYVTIGSGEKLSLYQFVNDASANADAGMKEPVDEDFIVPDYSYGMVTARNAKESDFNELYTSCTRDLYWYGESTWYSYSMEDALNRNWGDKTVQIHEATRNFVNKYGSTADENGYIKVTPEVKAALKEINAANGSSDWQWLWLCFDKVESGTRFDYEAWDEACSQWYQVRDRISLREQLQNPENDIAIKNLCVFEDGKLTVLANNVVKYDSMSGALMFNTVEMMNDAVNIDDIYSVYEVRDLLNLDMEEENHYLNLADGSLGRMTEDVLQEIEDLKDDGNAYLRFTEKNLYMRSSEGYLGVAPIKGKEIGSFEMISDDAGEYSVTEDDVVIYTAGVYSNNSGTYCDVYEYKNGKNSMLARDVLYDSIRFYEDGKLVTYTGYRYNSGYELTLVNKKGDMTLIADGVRSVVRADKNLMLYISDGDLYMYDGKDRKMICDDVDRFWAKEQMGAAASIYGN